MLSVSRTLANSGGAGDVMVFTTPNGEGVELLEGKAVFVCK